jgi:uncharacterized protein (DUF849 family)
MSQSPITVTYTLEEILARLERKIDILEGKVDTLQKDFTDFKTETKVGFESVKGEIKTLDEKVDGLSKRLENQEFVNRGILIALVVAILGGTAKLLGWIGHP